MSPLVVNQSKCEYASTKEKMKKYLIIAHELIKGIKNLSIRSKPKECNKLAHFLRKLAFRGIHSHAQFVERSLYSIMEQEQIFNIVKHSWMKGIQDYL